MKRQWLWAAGAVGAIFALTASWQHGERGPVLPAGAAQAQAAVPVDTFRLVWSQPVPALRSASLSPDGQEITTVGVNGHVQLWNWARHPDHPQWSRPLPGVTQTVVSPGGRTVLAYARLDPTRPMLFRLGAGGKLVTRSVLNGAIWDAVLSPDGAYAGVTTGPTAAAADSHSLYLDALGPGTMSHPVQLAGIGDSIAWSPNTAGLAVGTWDGSGVTCYTPTGQARWQYPAPSSASLADRLFDVQMAQEGQIVLGISYTNVRGEDGTLYVWNGQDGRLIWKYPLGEDTLDPQALISENGQRIAVSFTRLVTHGDQSIAERRLLVLDAQGNALWEKGGVLFSPTLVSVAADGHRVTVSDGLKTLYHLDASGRITAPYAFHSVIRKTINTPDGHWLLVYTGDGLLNLLRLD